MKPSFLEERKRFSSEEALLRSAFKRFKRPAPGVVLGPGDDAALLRASGLLVATQDDLAEGTHFERAWARGGEVGYKLVAVNVSDLAAMGAVRPLACLVSAGLPKAAPRAWIESFLDGVAEASRAFRIPVAGGNTTRAKSLFFSLCALGSLRGRAVGRGGARPGDWLGGVGPLGEASAGLRLLRLGRVPAWGRPLARAFWRPRPLLAEAAILSRFASALLDNSDGLCRSMEILGAASGVSVSASLAEAPASPALKRFAASFGEDLDARRWAGGEDYGLVFAAPARFWPRLRRALPGLYRLGTAGPGRGVFLEGRPAPKAGFEHFPHAR